MGFFGALWWSRTSVIGSGWLFAGMDAAVAAGPTAIYGWLIGGACVVPRGWMSAWFQLSGGVRLLRMPVGVRAAKDQAGVAARNLAV